MVAPSVDDYGNVSGADPTQCSLAQGNRGKTSYVIGQNVPKGGQCK